MAKLPTTAPIFKTRLRTGGMQPVVVEELGWAMLRCVLDRLAQRWPVVLAISGADPTESAVDRLGLASLSQPVTVIDQGEGDLGARLDRVWQAHASRRPVCFFGSDSPDVPSEALDLIEPSLENADVAIGPTLDGGYWTLAARAYRPQVLREIDWGGPLVYHQSCVRAAAAGITVRALPVWHDVDHPADVRALQQRLTGALGDLALLRLHDELNGLLASYAP